MVHSHGKEELKGLKIESLEAVDSFVSIFLFFSLTLGDNGLKLGKHKWEKRRTQVHEIKLLIRFFFLVTRGHGEARLKLSNSWELYLDSSILLFKILKKIQIKYKIVIPDKGRAW